MAAFKVNITKNGNAIKFQFTDSDHYLYGNGEIEVPVNSLSLVIDESDFVTFKKASTNDTFITFDPANSNLSDKAGVIEFYKTNMVGSTGGGGSESGITSGDVQTMIDESLDDYYDKDEVDSGFSTVNASLSGKADASDVTAVANDVSTLSGQVATKVAISDFNAYSAATDARLAEDEEVTAAALNDLDENKQDALVYYSEDTENNEAHITVEDTDFTSTTTVNSTTIDLSVESDDSGTHYNGYASVGDAGIQMGYDKMTGSDETDAHSNLIVEDGIISAEVYADEETTTVNIITAGVTINDENVLTDGIITTAVTSGSTDDEIPTAKATYDAIQAGGGGGATYSAGTNISIDTANTINCTLNARNGSGNGSLIIGDSECSASGNYSIAIGHNADNTGHYSISIGSNSSSKGSENLIWGSNNSITGSNSTHCFIFGTQIRNVDKAYNTAFGEQLSLRNNYETAFGTYNNSVTGSTASGQTLFSVGNGTSSARHNAFEIRQNGDIYVNDGTNDVRLQDTILALGGLKFAQVTQAQYDALVSGGTVDSSTIYFITNVVS